jgi:hypothetical protein
MVVLQALVEKAIACITVLQSALDAHDRLHGDHSVVSPTDDPDGPPASKSSRCGDPSNRIPQHVSCGHTVPTIGSALEIALEVHEVEPLPFLACPREAQRHEMDPLRELRPRRGCRWVRKRSAICPIETSTR